MAEAQVEIIGKIPEAAYQVLPPDAERVYAHFQSEWVGDRLAPGQNALPRHLTESGEDGQYRFKSVLAEEAGSPYFDARIAFADQRRARLLLTCNVVGSATPEGIGQGALIAKIQHPLFANLRIRGLRMGGLVAPLRLALDGQDFFYWDQSDPGGLEGNILIGRAWLQVIDQTASPVLSTIYNEHYQLICHEPGFPRASSTTPSPPSRTAGSR